MNVSLRSDAVTGIDQATDKAGLGDKYDDKIDQQADKQIKNQLNQQK